MTTALLAGTVFLAAGFVQGLTGFGSALVAIPLLSLLMDVKTAVPLCTLNGMIITMYLGWRLRNHLHW
ncbi:TSUP family transporter, partial [Desulfolithobacter sp.]